MAVMTITRWVADDSNEALERNRAEDTRLMQRINVAATELHRLWSADWPADAEQRVGWRSRASALQAEIDGLYERRRQLVAQRALLRNALPKGRRSALWPDALAA